MKDRETCYLLDLNQYHKTSSMTAFHLGGDLLLNCTYTGLMFLTPVNMKIDSKRSFVCKLTDTSILLYCQEILILTEPCKWYLICTSSEKFGYLKIILGKDNTVSESTFYVPDAQPNCLNCSDIIFFDRLFSFKPKSDHFLELYGTSNDIIYHIRLHCSPSPLECISAGAILCPKLPHWKHLPYKSYSQYYWHGCLHCESILDKGYRQIAKIKVNCQDEFEVVKLNIDMDDELWLDVKQPDTAHLKETSYKSIIGKQWKLKISRSGRYLVPNSPTIKATFQSLDTDTDTDDTWSIAIFDIINPSHRSATHAYIRIDNDTYAHTRGDIVCAVYVSVIALVWCCDADSRVVKMPAASIDKYIDTTPNFNRTKATQMLIAHAQYTMQCLTVD